ncbi:HD domain-containing protein [Flavobacterium sp. 3HN19-14]|uniref:HD domain-containing protein n=1 Tax=Flavobacterium sp. 3HN19-14 TaxID=3448133 RepID=UPI003EE0F675
MLDKPESKFILQKLTDELAEQLQYHTVEHTLDVYNIVKIIAEEENISPENTRLLLIAALYHDSGYLIQGKGHEAVSCKIAGEVLPDFGYDDSEIEEICRIISATKIPQNPKSKLEEIICDADLDYLGRDDFFILGDKLYNEMLASGAVTNRDEWNRLQIEFLQLHRYFTKTAQQLRNKKKEENLKILLAKTNL